MTTLFLNGSILVLSQKL